MHETHGVVGSRGDQLQITAKHTEGLLVLMASTTFEGCQEKVTCTDFFSFLNVFKCITLFSRRHSNEKEEWWGISFINQREGLPLRPCGGEEGSPTCSHQSEVQPQWSIFICSSCDHTSSTGLAPQKETEEDGPASFSSLYFLILPFFFHN